MRRCIGCQQSRPQRELMRFTVCGTSVRADDTIKNEGRGYYLCRDRECLEKSFKRKAWNRILRARTDNEEIRMIVETALNNN